MRNLVWLLAVVFAASIARAQESKPKATLAAFPRDYRSPDIRIKEATDDIKAVIAKLRERGEDKEADRIANRLKEIRDLLTGEFREPKVEIPEAEMHAIGLYHGEVPPEVEKTAKNPIGFAAVKVTYTGRPIILVLTAYEPIAWNVTLADGVKVQKVVFCGYYGQDVTGLPSGIPVEGKAETRDGARPSAYKVEELSGRFGDYLRKNFGAEPVSFQGTYEYRGIPFVVGPENAIFRAEKVWQQLQPFHHEVTKEDRDRLVLELKKIRFAGMYSAAKLDRSPEEAVSLAMFNPLGPIKSSMRPLLDSTRHVAFDTESERYFGIRPSAEKPVVEFDPTSGRFEPLVMPDMPDDAAYLAYDSKRKRLVVAGKKSLFSIDLEERKVTELRSKPANLAGLTYAADEDALYAVRSTGFGSEISVIRELLKLNEHGAVVSWVTLQRPIIGGTHSSEARIFAQGGKVIVLPWDNSRIDEDIRPAPASYVVDAKTGKQLFAAIIEVQAE